MKTKWLRLCLAVIMALFFSITVSANPHPQTAQCLLNGDDVCNNVCRSCHFPEAPPDLYKSKDSDMCDFCHIEESVGTEGTALLLTHGGNHPSQIEYEPGGYDSELNENPSGPVLYCNSSASKCMMRCSTCHNPHGDAPALLRTSNRGSALCLSCHRK